MSWMHYLPPRFLPVIQALPEALAKQITEVRLRLEKPFSITAGGRNLLPDETGCLRTTADALRVTRGDLEEMLSRLTEGSLYAFEEPLGNGYLPLPDGCRAGVAGETILSPGGRLRFRRITSVNLRISRFLPSFARPLTDRLREGSPVGALIISPPAGGKTTFLRSAAWQLSTGVRPYRVGIADERGELEIPDGLCDRITGCEKAKAIELLTRTMSPEYLLCDELGVGEEGPLLAAQNTGVRLIASVHGGCLEEATQRPCARTLLEAGLFGYLVLLEPGYRVRIFTEKGEAVCG
ncbi:MAG: hypothetical protein J1E00_02655 [Oscillospiraceae bacterium]|nr:hypothetical protein [Oscillospiraceae bacterium]